MKKVTQIAKKTISVLSMIVVVIELVIIASIVVSKISGNIPSVFGYHMYVIVSPSMSPDLEIGDIIISREYDGGDLRVGQVVEYVGKSGTMDGKIITHRIESISGEGDDRVIITKGTANPEADPPISPSDIVAVMTYKTVLISKIYTVLNTTAGFICLVLLPMAAMIVVELVRFILDVKGENHEENEEN